MTIIPPLVPLKQRNSNENTYTHLWTGRFFGFRYLRTTVKNTESPRRVSPFNIYFHMFSGEKQASLSAMKENLEFARTQTVIPITASRYAASANGFYTAEIHRLGNNNAWRITNRGGLQTVRFDQAEMLSVDLNQSAGVLGQYYHQGNLYVALDPATPSPIISLNNNENIGVPPVAEVPYLIESTWEIKSLQNSKTELTFNAQGYGHGFMRWKFPTTGVYLVTLTRQDAPPLSFLVTVTDSHVLSVDFGKATATDEVSVTIRAQ